MAGRGSSPPSAARRHPLSAIRPPQAALRDAIPVLAIPPYSQPWSRAMRAASVRLAAPSLLIASDR